MLEWLKNTFIIRSLFCCTSEPPEDVGDADKREERRKERERKKKERREWRIEKINAIKEKIYAVASKRKWLFFIIAGVIAAYLLIFKGGFGGGGGGILESIKGLF